MKKKLISIMFFVSIMLLFSSCSNDSKELVLGTAGAFPPFNYLGGVDGREPMGFDVELAKIIAADQGKELRIEIIPFRELIPAVKNGEIDMAISFIAITDERKQLIDFSNEYFSAPTITLIRKSDINNFRGINSKEALGENKKLGVMHGTLQEVYTLDMAVGHEVLITETYDMAVDALLNNKVDAVILPTLLAKRYIESHNELAILQGVDIARTMGGIAVKKGDKKLLGDINKTLKRLFDSGEYNKMIEEHVY